MSSCVLWLDSERVKLFKFSVKEMTDKTMRKHTICHSNPHKDAHALHEQDHFFKDIAHIIGEVDRLLIFGPGQARLQFKNYLEKHHVNDLHKHIVCCEPMDHATDVQILEHAKRFFSEFENYPKFLDNSYHTHTF